MSVDMDKGKRCYGLPDSQIIGKSFSSEDGILRIHRRERRPLDEVLSPGIPNMIRTIGDAVLRGFDAYLTTNGLDVYEGLEVYKCVESLLLLKRPWWSRSWAACLKGRAPNTLDSSSGAVGATSSHPNSMLPPMNVDLSKDDDMDCLSIIAGWLDCDRKDGRGNIQTLVNFYEAATMELDFSYVRYRSYWIALEAAWGKKKDTVTKMACKFAEGLGVDLDRVMLLKDIYNVMHHPE